jgi:chemotaxis protein MotA
MADKNTAKVKSGGPDLISAAGILLAVGGIAGGLIMEGGRIQDVAQITAAVIVLAGTFGAVMVSTPGSVLKGALKRLAGVFIDSTPPSSGLITELIGYATKARKSGLVSLEDDTDGIRDPFLKKALTLAVDGTDLQELRNMMELDMAVAEHQAEAEAKVFESAGGYAPTIGIIGAVLGLIQVMKNLANIDEVGHGIAVAFVATVYGVGMANLFFLPAASKIKARAAVENRRREMILDGVAGIVEGLNPKIVQIKLAAYELNGAAPAKESPTKSSRAAKTAPAEA